MKSLRSHKAFNDLVNSGKPFVIDFYADWCGPCKSLTPIMDKLATEFKDDVEIVKANVDQQRDLAQKFNVRSIPAVFFMEGNKIKDSFMGLNSETEIRKKIKALA